MGLIIVFVWFSRLVIGPQVHILIGCRYHRAQLLCYSILSTSWCSGGDAGAGRSRRRRRRRRRRSRRGRRRWREKEEEEWWR